MIGLTGDRKGRPYVSIACCLSLTNVVDFLYTFLQEGNAMLPKDPMLLLSVVNTKLRDEYDSLEALCEDLGEDEEELKARLAAVGFDYQPQLRQFR